MVPPAGLPERLRCSTGVWVAAATPAISDAALTAPGSLVTSSCALTSDNATIACPALQLPPSTPLGVVLAQVVECEWQATGERLRLPPLSMVVTNVSVIVAVDVRMDVVGNVPASLNASVMPTWLSAPLPPVVVCVVETTGVSSPLTLAATSATAVTWSSVVSLPFVLSGPPLGATTARVRCVVWDQAVASQPFVLATTPLAIVAVSGPSAVALLSSLSSPWPLSLLAVRVQAPGVTALADVTCSLAVRVGHGFSLLAADSGAADVAFSGRTPDPDGTIAFPSFGVTGRYESGWAARLVSLEVACARAGGSPPPLLVNLTILPARMVVCVPPAGASTSQTALPPFVVAVVLGPDASSEEAARAAACASPPRPPPIAAWPPLVCRIVQRDTANATAPEVLLQGASVVNSASQPLTAAFSSFALTAPPAATYALRLACSLGDVSLPQVSHAGELLPAHARRCALHASD
jgi:hypothetical protein